MYSSKIQNKESWKGHKTGKLWLLARFHFVETRMQEDIVLFLRIIELMPFWPIIANCISIYLPIMIETTRGDRLLQLLGSLQLCSRIFIPKGKPSIRTSSGKCPMYGMKLDIIDSINILILLIGSIRTMTLEGEVFLLESNKHHKLEADQLCVLH